jgi:ribose/xylose/arabinose/galactoside ABC-type transport system permease subunit
MAGASLRAFAPDRMRRNRLVITLIAAAIALVLVVQFLNSGPAAALQTLFFVALLAFVIGVVRLLVPPR